MLIARQQNIPTWAGGLCGLCASFIALFIVTLSYRLSKFWCFDTIALIIVIVIVIEVFLSLSYRNVIFFDINTSAFVVFRFSSPFLSLLVVLCLSCWCTVLFCLSHLRGGARHLFSTLYFFISSLVSSSRLFFPSVKASRLLAFVCHTCRIRYDGKSLHCLICLLRYNVVSLSRVCDHRACISLGGEPARTLGVLDVDG